MIRNNPLSYAISLGALVGLLFFSTFPGTLVIPSIIMYMLLFAGLFLGDKFKASGDEPEPDDKALQEIFFLGIFGLMTFLVLSLFIPQVKILNGGLTVQFNTFLGAIIPPLSVSTMWSSPWTAAFIFAVFIVPPAEEQFFRVLIGNIAAKFSEGNPLFFMIVVPLVGSVPVILALVVGGFFATFHLSAYSLNYTVLVILWGAGSMLYYIDVRAGNPVPSILSHGANNALSFLVGGNILAPYFPSIQPVVAAPHLMLALPLGMLLITEYRRRRKK